MTSPETASYEAQAVQTKSNVFHGNLVELSAFRHALISSVSVLEYLDKIKKTLFYGKENAMLKPIGGQETCEHFIFSAFPDPVAAIDIVHAIIGKATEAGESLELLLKTIDGVTFDPVNFKEEIGDGQWYDAIGLTAVGATIAEVQATNIAKLRARFPQKFTEFDANNRNLDAERQILES